jgi:hypothetical protein
MVCEAAAHDMWSHTKKGFYGSGIINSKKDPYKVERTGRLGEFAVAKTLNCAINFDYIQFGDSHDILLNDKKLDVKTASYNYGCGLVRVEGGRGRAIPLKSDIYCFAFIKEDDTENKTAIVVIAGFTTKEKLEKLKHVDARQGNHKNVEIPYKKLKDIGELKNGDKN